MSLYYPGLKRGEFSENRRFVADRLLALRSGLKQLPQKTLDRSLTVASWNLRDFGKKPGTGFNPEARLPESLYYIAEVLDRFDVTALQEINENLDEFEKLMKILGSHYDYIGTDVTEGSGGNGERMIFLYDRRKVSFRNIAGEVVLPGKDVTQFARTPFVVSFQCGWLKFDLCTAHLYFGDDSGVKKQRRIDEIANLGSFMMKRALNNKTNTFILGDFNVVGPKDETWLALEKSGFKMPDSVRDVRTNMDGEKYYDRIAFASAREEILFDEAKPGGTFQVYDHVFRAEDEAHYRAIAQNMGSSYEKWKTWQISDHLPLWVHLETDFSDGYLKRLN